MKTPVHPRWGAIDLDRRTPDVDPLEVYSHSKKENSDSVKLQLGTEYSVGMSAIKPISVLSSYNMRMGLYTINLGTTIGQRLHTCHLVILPLIPVFILLTQNASTYINNIMSIGDIREISNQVNNAIDFAKLTRMLQEERVSVALNYFIEDRDNLTSLLDLDKYVETDEKEFLNAFVVANAFNNTDSSLQSVNIWPTIAGVEYFKTKLKFQIKHSLFRSKIREKDKTIEEVFAWYNEINDKTLTYVTYSIHDSDLSNFYRLIIGYKNLLRAVEFAGKAGILGLEYFASRELSPRKFENFLKFDVLRREYLNQTLNFIPRLRNEYDALNDRNSFASSQNKIINRVVIDNDIRVMVQYFIRFLKYAKDLRELIKGVADTVKLFVKNDISRLKQENITPLLFMIILLCFIPICVIFTLNITSNRMRYSKLYSEKVVIYNNEQKKTEKLLESLLPNLIINQMKKGEVPKPEVFDNTTIFFCDIVNFTNIASESTAHQIIDFLNMLYSMFDDRINSYDVYKVETIGDAYMVASGVPATNGNQHAVEIAKMSLDLLTKIGTFQIQHKPGYRLKLRMGMHSGQVVGGVVGTKIPHYSVFGSALSYCCTVLCTVMYCTVLYSIQ